MPIIRFGTFEVHLESSELYKNGRLIPLQQQPFQVLRALVERPGELVTREHLRKVLWPDGVTVDFDQSVNKSITKLRYALGDTASSPRFIETLPKRGYRFIAPVATDATSATGATGATRAVGASGLSGATGGVGANVIAKQPARWLRWSSVAVLMMVALFAVASMLTTRATSVEAQVELLTESRSTATSPIFAARDAYERGRLALARRSQESLRLGVEHFNRAIALSPRFADAYVGLADSWSLMSSYGLVDPSEGMPRAREAANRALTLEPMLARAHASLGRTTMIFDWDWRTAEWHFARAIALEPGDPTTHQWYAYFLSALGRHDQAIAEARRGVAAAPLALNPNTALGFVLYLARRYDEAAAQLERTLEIDPDFAQARRDLALVRVQQRRHAEAVTGMVRVTALNPGSPAALAELAWVYALSGEHPAALRLLAKLDRIRTTSYVPPDSLALVHWALGAHDTAIAWLERAFATRVATLAHLPVDPIWDSIRQNAHVQNLTRKILERQ